MTPAGELNERIKLLEPHFPDRLAREAITTYHFVAERWAKVSPLFGRKLAAFRQAAFEATHEVEMRYEAWMTPQHRVCWGDNEYAIETFVDKDNKHETLVLNIKRQSGAND